MGERERKEEKERREEKRMIRRRRGERTGKEREGEREGEENDWETREVGWERIIKVELVRGRGRWRRREEND